MAILRKPDFLARVGGDEFCILLPNANSGLAATMARHFRETIDRQQMDWHGSRIPVPASIGFVEWQPTSEIALSESLPLADNEMFGSKRRGQRAPAETGGETVGS